MINITVKEIADITGARLFSKNEKDVISGFSIDSRRIKPGQFFIAVKGGNFDGHDFIREAVKKGAAGLILENSGENVPVYGVDHVIFVEDTRSAMGLIAGRIRRSVNVPVICVTGTNGKTTLKEILAHILAAKYRVLKSEKSYNNLIGLSLSLFEFDPSYDIAVLELGSNHPGEIRELAEIARPEAAVYTNIGNGHLEYFGDRQGVFNEKISLLDFLSVSGTAFLNKDDDLLREARTHKSDIKFYGKASGCDFQITDIEEKKDGCAFSLNGDRFSVPFEGEHNVYNAAAAAAAARHFGIADKDIRKKLASAFLPAMRLEKISSGDILFLNDSYNANPDSFAGALGVLRDNYDGVRKGVVAGDMLELGEASCELHKTAGRRVVDSGVDFLVALGEEAGYMIEGALESGMPEDRAFIAEDHEGAAEIVRRMASPGTVVLLKGSRALKMEEVIKCFTILYTH